MGSRIAAFAQKTYCHGIGDLYRSKSCCGKLLWIITLILCGLLLARYIFCTVACFMHANPEIVSTTEEVNELQLPNIMICDMDDLNLTTLVEDGFPSKTEELELLTLPYLEPQPMAMMKNQHDLIQDFMQKRSFKTLNQFLEKYVYGCETTVEDIPMMHHPKKDYCKSSWILHSFHNSNCRAFRLGAQYLGGTRSGVQIKITRPFDRARESLRQRSVGFSVAFFSGFSPVVCNPSHIGYGSAAYFALSAERITRLQSLVLRKYNLCAPRPEYGSDCEFVCFANEVFRKCGCYPLGLMPDANYSKITNSGCTAYQLGSCAVNMSRVQKCFVECRPLCSEHVYKSTMTTVALDNKHMLNYSILSIGYIQLHITHLTETNSFTFTALVSNTGGILGLFMGISAASIIQMCFICACGSDDSFIEEHEKVTLKDEDVKIVGVASNLKIPSPDVYYIRRYNNI